MSVKKEPSGRRSVQVEVEVPGTPEEVWRAIATGSGISSWFIPTEVEERMGGKITMHFGPGMDSTATITAWEPPLRFAADSNWGETSPMVATEWFVEARSGGVCLVRVVHSLFAETDDWDDQLEGTETGWPVYFLVLKLYLKSFRGTHGNSFIATGFSQDSEAATWDKLMRSLAITGISVGEVCQTGSDAPQLSGAVEWTSKDKSPRSIMIRLEEPAPGIELISVADCGGSMMLTVSLFLYGESAREIFRQQEAAWQTWMSKHFPAPIPSNA